MKLCYVENVKENNEVIVITTASLQSTWDLSSSSIILTRCTSPPPEALNSDQGSSSDTISIRSLSRATSIAVSPDWYSFESCIRKVQII